MSKIIFNIKTLIIILSIIGTGLVIISTLNYNVGLSDDSISYLAAADNLLLGKGFIDYHGQPFQEWPPLYPILLFFLSSLFGFETLHSALLLNALLFGLIIYTSGMILRTYINSTLLILIGVILILFSRPVFYRTLDMHSEITFIFLICWYIIFLVSYLEKKNLLSFTMLIIITAILILTRFIGIACIFTTIVTILIFNQESIRKKIFSILIYSLLSLVFISIWLIRTYLVSSSLTGPRGTSKYSFIENIYLTIYGVLEWLIPKYFLENKIFFLIILLIIISSGVFFLKEIRYKNLLSEASKKLIIISCLFLFFYLFLLILLSTFYAHDPIDSRLLAPIYIPLLLIVLIISQSFLTEISFSKLRLSKRLLVIFIIIAMCIYPFMSVLKKIDMHINNGNGYSGITWENYDTLGFIKIASLSSINKIKIYSNAPQEVYFSTKMYSTWSPWKTYYNSDQIYFNISDLESGWPNEKEAFLVWFREIDDINGWLFDLNELASISEMSIADTSNKIDIYYVKRKSK